MTTRSSYLENRYQETLGEVRKERDELLIKVAALERKLVEHELRKKAEDVLMAAAQSDHMPQAYHVYSVADFLNKRAALVRSGQDGLTKAAAAVELIVTGSAPGFELGEPDLDDEMKNDPLAHLYT